MSKKGSNIPSNGALENRPPLNIPEKRITCEDVFKPGFLADIFNEWNKRYSTDPKSFSDCLDQDGKPVKDYGEHCAIYFQKISDELSKE